MIFPQARKNKRLAFACLALLNAYVKGPAGRRRKTAGPDASTKKAGQVSVQLFTILL